MVQVEWIWIFDGEGNTEYGTRRTVTGDRSLVYKSKGQGHSVYNFHSYLLNL